MIVTLLSFSVLLYRTNHGCSRFGYETCRLWITNDERDINLTAIYLGVSLLDSVEGGAHAEEPDEEQLRTLWCGGINEKVTEEVKTFCFHSFISDSSPLAGWLWPGLENILLLTFPMFQFRFCMNCSWMPDLWRGWPYPRTGTQNSRRILGSSSLSMRIVSSLRTTFSTAWSYIEARSGFKTRPQDWVSSACKHQSWRISGLNNDRGGRDGPGHHRSYSTPGPPSSGSSRSESIVILTLFQC